MTMKYYEVPNKNLEALRQKILKRGVVCNLPTIGQLCDCTAFGCALLYWETYRYSVYSYSFRSCSGASLFNTLILQNQTSVGTGLFIPTGH